ncbi:MAG: methyltransferase, TrmH family [Actinomycetota bacterium]|nr:methyltransferase, TrmH family [Actinomycetota bacterium]
MAVATSPLVGLPEVAKASGLVLILAGVSDPGNAGTLIRTAAAAGADAVIFTEGSADPLNPKTARASAAALFATHLVADVSLEDAVGHVRSLGFVVIGAESGETSSIYETDLGRPLALVLGNESWGLPGPQRGLLDEVVSIPMPGTVESLNVATAGSIIIFEALRQRQLETTSTVSSASKEATSE